MFEWIEKGGLIMKILLIVNCLGWSLMLWKGISIFLFNKKINQNKEKFLSFMSQFNNDNLKLSEGERLNITLFHFMEPYYNGMNTIRIIASISPLLGLLGTVMGILGSFSVIADKGLDNPGLFAEGISLALITTVGGLIVAIPHFVGHNYLKGYLKQSERKLEESLIFRK